MGSGMQPVTKRVGPDVMLMGSQVCGSRTTSTAVGVGRAGDGLTSEQTPEDRRLQEGGRASARQGSVVGAVTGWGGRQGA